MKCCEEPNVQKTADYYICLNCDMFSLESDYVQEARSFEEDDQSGFDYSANSLASPTVLPRLGSANRGTATRATMSGTFPVTPPTISGSQLSVLPRLTRAHSTPPASTVNMVSKQQRKTLSQVGKKKLSRAAKDEIKRAAWESPDSSLGNFTKLNPTASEFVPSKDEPLQLGESPDFSSGDFTMSDYNEAAPTSRWSTGSTKMNLRSTVTNVLSLVDQGGYRNPTIGLMHELLPKPRCSNCRKEGHLKNECPLCLRCNSADHKTFDCDFGIPKFVLFMKLPVELRERIYEYALAADQPINPHLCDSFKDAKTGAPSIKFHDDNQRNHGAVTKLLGVTRVNKQISKESFKLFYSANVFRCGQDTTIYFARLEYLGRFNLIRHVCFGIDMHSVRKAPSFLRRMNQYIKEEAAYERSLGGAPVGAAYSTLVAHPQYNCGGITELNMLIALRKLASPITTDKKGKGKAKATYASKIVLPVPSVQAFNSYERLRWFPTTLHGLGISVHYVERHALDYYHSSIVGLTWQQRFQKKDFEDTPGYVNPVGNDGQTEAYRSALALNPNLESQPRASAYAYMRTDCQGHMKEWRKMATEGGGIMGATGNWE